MNGVVVTGDDGSKSQTMQPRWARRQLLYRPSATSLVSEAFVFVVPFCFLPNYFCNFRHDVICGAMDKMDVNLWCQNVRTCAFDCRPFTWTSIIFSCTSMRGAKTYHKACQVRI